MTFNSIQFAVFFAIFLLAYWKLPRQFQNPLLLVGSYVFYGWWDWRFLSLLALSTIVDFNIARRMHAESMESRRKALLWVSVAVNLSILGVFKYSGFFLDSFYELLSSLGVDGRSPIIDLVLPVGISFYTFQTISYSFDVFRRRIEPTENLLNFAVYVAYFPQLVAGPIERAQNLLPRIEAERVVPDEAAIRGALTLIVGGLFKKVVIADGVAQVANAVFDDPAVQSGPMVLIGVVAFALQIYGDFSGYTDIARGVSQLLGIDLVVNFRQPYLSRNITEFWRRWHISLSNWLRDYLYIPLGGNRGSVAVTMRNLMLTMLLGGLWHGASWNFVVWGGLNGLYLAVHRLAFGARVATNEPTLPDVPRILGTFALTCLAWVFFRAATFADATEVLRRIVTMADGSFVSGDALLVLGVLVIVVLIDIAQRARAERAPRPTPQWALGMAAACFGVLLFSGGAPEPFIYFQF